MRLHDRLKKIYPANEVCRLIDAHFARIDGLEQYVLGIHPRVDATERSVDEIAASMSALLEGMACLVQQMQQHQKAHQESDQKRDREYGVNRHMASAIESFNASLLDLDKRVASIYARISQDPNPTNGTNDGLNRSTIELLNNSLLDTASQSHERIQATREARNDHQSLAENGTPQEIARFERSVGIAEFDREIGQRHSGELQPIHDRRSHADNVTMQELAYIRKQVTELAGFVRELDHRQSNQMQQVLKCLSHASPTPAALTLRADSQEIGPFLRALPQGAIVMKTPELWNPEAALLIHLAPLLGNRTALDVGAGKGAISGRLLAAGYEVFAFEPFPRAFSDLQGRLGNDERFHGYQLALGYSDGPAKLHITEDRSSTSKYRDVSPYNSLLPHSMPGDIQFNGTIDVRLRSLDSLVRANLVPSDVGVIAIDTEGYDLEVMRGMSSCSCQVLMAEFWDPKMIFGKSGAMNRLSDMVREVSPRGYRWHIVVYRLDSQPISYYCNQSDSVEESWGNVIFFRDRTIFDEALKWCSTVMAPTYFAGEAPANETLHTRAMGA